MAQFHFGTFKPYKKEKIWENLILKKSKISGVTQNGSISAD